MTQMSENQPYQPSRRTDSLVLIRMTRCRSGVALLLVALAYASLTVVGCGIISEDADEPKNYEIVEGPVGDLYRFCIESGADPSQYEYDIYLYWDDANIPNPNFSYLFLSVKNTATAGGLWDRLGFDYYEYEDIPEDSGFPAAPGPGWKVRIWGASMRFCQTCYTDNGLLRLIEFHGPMDQVEFVWDPADSTEAYVRWTLMD